MNTNHVSDLLAPFARDELSGSQAQEVREHLEGCAGCRTELTAVRALLAPPGEPMDEGERAALHAALDRVEKDDAVRPGVMEFPPRLVRRWHRRPGALVGAAATILLLLGAVAYVTVGGGTFGGGGDDDAATLESTADAPDGDGRPLPLFAAPGGGGPEAEGRDLDGEDASTDAEQEAATGYGDEKRTSLLSEQSLEDAIVAGDFATFAASYQPGEAPALVDEFGQILASGAPDEPLGEQTRECVRTVMEAGTGPLLPVYATIGTFEEQPALAIGFITTGDGDRFESYTFFVWPEGTCERPISSFFGSVDD